MQLLVREHRLDCRWFCYMKNELTEALDAMKKLSPLLLAGAGEFKRHFVFACIEVQAACLCRILFHILQQQSGEGTGSSNRSGQ